MRADNAEPIGRIDAWLLASSAAQANAVAVNVIVRRGLVQKVGGHRVRQQRRRGRLQTQHTISPG